MCLFCLAADLLWVFKASSLSSGSFLAGFCYCWSERLLLTLQDSCWPEVICSASALCGQTLPSSHYCCFILYKVLSSHQSCFALCQYFGKVNFICSTAVQGVSVLGLFMWLPLDHLLLIQELVTVWYSTLQVVYSDTQSVGDMTWDSSSAIIVMHYN